MTTITLQHQTVVDALNKVKTAAMTVALSAPPVSALDDNSLQLTGLWTEREEIIHTLVQDYSRLVQECVEATKLNVDVIKDQDEAISRQTSGTVHIY